MKAHLTNPTPLSLIVGVLAFTFASFPVSLAQDRDRQMADPIAQGYRHDARVEEMIHRSLAQDDALSDAAKNVKVVTTNGNVILKGNVASYDEKLKIEQLVKRTVKTALIENDLKVVKP
jgi:osmotically-inducible protein OsmY